MNGPVRFTYGAVSHLLQRGAVAKRSAAHQRAIDAAKSAERRAGKKVSRNEARGINVAHSQFDPRVGAKNVESMTTNQAKAHARNVERFVSRGTQFVSLFAGSPAPRSMWDEYKRLEGVNNQRAADFLAKYGGRTLPEQDLTISARIAMTTPEQRANNQGRVHEQIDRKAFSIVGADKLEKLIDSMKKKARGDYLSRTVRARLNSGEGALRNAGFGDMEKEVEALTLEQKQLLIDASTFFDIAVENMVGSPPKSEVKEYRDAWYEEHEGHAKSEEVYNALRQQLDWVKEIAPRGNAATGGGAGSGKSATRRNSRRRKAN